ncbi:MAG: chemotaxis protein CheD [bacterium]|nr:chemotaxis protein CheD [bacterium]
MNQNVLDLPTINLLPGELYIAKQPSIISTLLGSCVSICLYAPAFKVGAMCHCLLPLYSARSSREETFKYVDQAIRYMVNKMKEMNIPQDKIMAKIFGGADMLLKLNDHPSLSIGRQNIEVAKAILQEYRIPIEKEDTGGSSGRKIFFLSSTGKVWVKRISSDRFTDKERILWPSVR